MFPQLFLIILFSFQSIDEKKIIVGAERLSNYLDRISNKIVNFKYSDSCDIKSFSKRYPYLYPCIHVHNFLIFLTTFLFFSSSFIQFKNHPRLKWKNSAKAKLTCYKGY